MDLASVVAGLAAVAAAWFAYQAIRQNAKNQQDLLVQSLHDKFLDINRDFAMNAKQKGGKLTDHDNELLANLLERVGYVVRYKSIPIGEFGAYRTMTLEKSFQEFVANYRKKHGEEYFEDLSWLIDMFRMDNHVSRR